MNDYIIELMLVIIVLGLVITLFIKNRKFKKLKKEFDYYKDCIETEYP
jgi:hypothetical protein